ncbi:heparan sulfate glucosamine 3-O-sulfotransferase 1-like [Apostichopus japonicus]|uniref:heparan sulfate glucosamine 3-O-sulfotransferase 1-like n=1 Tax=Stichopus japonicus TaxID=307972 RepID=UPI003AB2B575
MAVQKRYILACCVVLCLIVLCHYQRFWGQKYTIPIKQGIKKPVVHDNFNRWKRLLANRSYAYSSVIVANNARPYQRLKTVKKESGLPARIDLHVGNLSVNSSNINRTCFFFENGNVYKPVPWDKEVLKTRHCSRRLPDAIIFGTRQCGASKLDFYLRTHPDIAFTAREEMHFFGSPKETRGIDWYRNQMMLSKANQVTMEKTPKYFVRPTVPKKLRDNLGVRTKLVLVLRDPVERAMYDFLQLRLLWDEKGTELMDRWADFNGTLDNYYFLLNSSFETTVLRSSGQVRQENALVYIGCYSYFLDRWLKYFPPSQILIVDHEELERDPVPVLKRTEKFLRVSQYFTEDKMYLNPEKQLHCLSSPFNHCADENQGRVLPEVDKAVVQKLREFYKPYNQKLCQTFPQTCRFSWM